MSADFVPARGVFTDLTPFRYWCQKVMPLVYDDSLSYYELLCKVVDYLNKTMEDVNTLNTDVTSMYTAFSQLQEYVNTYFDNLDIQTEINRKLDYMASNGELSALISPFIPSLVTGWLDENVTPTTPVVDASLTISGAAADAKATGDAIDFLKTDFKTDGTYIENLEWVNGGIDNTTGENNNDGSLTRSRTDNYYLANQYTTIENKNTSSSAVLFVIYYDEHYNFVDFLRVEAGTTSEFIDYENAGIRYASIRTKYVRFDLRGGGSSRENIVLNRKTATNVLCDKDVFLDELRKREFKKDEFVTGSIQPNGDIDVYSINRITTPFIKVFEGEILYFSYPNAYTDAVSGLTIPTTIRIIGFDSNKIVNNVIQQSYAKLCNIKIPDNTEFVRISYGCSDSDGFQDNLLNVYHDNDFVIENNTANIATVTQFAENTETVIPSYWRNSVDTVVANINSELVKDENSASFGFVTDTHITGNAGYSGILLNEVMKKCNIPVWFHGGDAVGGEPVITKAGLINQMDKDFSQFAIVENIGLRAIGNHDPVFGTDNYNYNMTNGESNHYYHGIDREKYLQQYGSGKGKGYFYKDITKDKLRCIVLDIIPYESQVNEDDLVTGSNKLNYHQFGSEQLNWFANVLASTPDNYSVVVCSHIAPVSQSELRLIDSTWVESTPIDYVQARKIAEAYKLKSTYTFNGSISGDTTEDTYNINVDFTNANGDFVCFFCGHTHKDWSLSLDNVWIIGTANDSLAVSDNASSYAPSKTRGTNTEHIIDFFCIKPETHSLTIVRLGAYVDSIGRIRNYTY